jgi:myo-inositol-1(or 4)-monophosphatase
MTSTLTPLEANVLQATSSLHAADLGVSEIESWTAFGLRSVMDACARLRVARVRPELFGFHLKDDGSPSTQIELAVEEDLRRDVLSFDSAARFVGEETGGDPNPRGYTVAVDPVDGTWSYISGTETCAMTLAVFLDGEIVAGVVGSPVTGEIAYASHPTGARLVQLGYDSAGSVGSDLPLYEQPSGKVLVNLHPTRAATNAVQALYRAWNTGAVRLVRSTGGSPSWALVDVAKGVFTYTSLWEKRAAEPFDLAAGCFIVRQAGGEIVDVTNSPIYPDNHRGPFVAGIVAESRTTMLGILRDALDI